MCQTKLFFLHYIGLIFLAIREFLQFITNVKKYIGSFENIMEVLIILLTTINIILLYFSKDWAIHFGAWAVFFGMVIHSEEAFKI